MNAPFFRGRMGRVIPTTPIIAAIGTSSVERSTMKLAAGASGNLGWIEYGWLTWLGRLCPQIRLSLDHAFGFSGMSSTTLKDNIGLVQAATPRPAACIIQVTQNDIYQISTSTAISNYEFMCRTLLASGIVPILALQHWQNGITGANLGTGLELVQRVRAIPFAIPGVALVDLAVPTLDHQSASVASRATMMEPDNAHLNFLGAYAAATQLKKVIDGLFPPVSASFAAAGAGDLWTVDTPYGALNLNPTMAGTSGNLGTGVTGQVAASWWAGMSVAGSGISVAASKATLADGRLVQRFTATGTVAARGYLYFDATMVSGALAALHPGDKLRVQAHYGFTGAGVQGIGCRWSPTETGRPGINYRDGVVWDTADTALPAHEGVLTSPPHTIVAAVTAGAVRFTVNLPPVSTVCNYVMDIGPVAVKRVFA